MLFTDLNFSGHRVFSRKLHFFTEPAFLADTAFFHGSCTFSRIRHLQEAVMYTGQRIYGSNIEANLTKETYRLEQSGEQYSPE